MASKSSSRNAARFFRASSRDFAESRMCRKRAAAGLFPGHDNFAAVGGEHADSSFIELGEGDIGDAAGKKSHTGPARPNRREGPANTAEEESVLDAGQKAIAVGKAKQLENANAARDGLQAGPLIEARKAGRVFDEMGSGEKLLEKEVACGASDPGALVRALNARTGVLHQFPVFDTGGAGRFAGAAVETFVEGVD